MAKVFVSYRRADNAAGYAMDLARILREAFGEAHVFRDMRSIPPGVDFGVHIKQALQNCAVMLVMIGRHWALERTPDGRLRLFEPDDWVRIEVATALAAAHVRVIPVLVGGGALPSADQLPPDLQPLLSRHAVSLEDNKWESDVASLVAHLEQIPGMRSWWDRLRRRPANRDGPAGRGKRRFGLATAAVVAVLTVAGVIGLLDEYGAFDTLVDPPRPLPVERIQSELAATTRPPSTMPQQPAQATTPLIATQQALLPTVPDKGGISLPSIDVTGSWIDGQGNRYRFDQTQDEIAIRQTGGPTAAFGRGDGFIAGRSVEFDFYISGFLSSSGTLVLSPDGRSMQGSVTDTSTGLVLPLYLRRL